METNKKVKILYKNHRGEIAIREIIPIEIYYGSTDFHTEVQWLLKAYALDRGEERNFAMKEIAEWNTM